MASQKGSFLFKLATEIHDINDIPFNHHGDPDVGYRVIKAICTSMAAALRRGETVSIRGFGKFKPVLEKSGRRTGSNFATQSRVRYATPLQHRQKRYVKFIPSEQLLAMLNRGTNWDEKRAMEIWDK